MQTIDHRSNGRATRPPYGSTTEQASAQDKVVSADEDFFQPIISSVEKTVIKYPGASVAIAAGFGLLVAIGVRRWLR